MNRSRSAWLRLDLMLRGIEEGVITATDREVLAGADSTASARQVRSIIEKRLAAGRRPSRVRMAVKEVAGHSGTRIPSSIQEKRRLLQMVVATRPGVPTEMRVAFSGSQEPSDGDVDRMLRRLIRLGIFDDSKPD